MVKSKLLLLNDFVGIVDVFVTIVSFVAAYYARGFFHPIIPLVEARSYLLVCFVTIPVWSILLRWVGLGKVHRLKSYALLFLDYAFVVFMGTLVLLTTISLLKLPEISRLFLIMFASSNLLLLFLARLVVREIIRYYRLKGKFKKSCMIIADEHAGDLINTIVNKTLWGYNIKVIITDSEAITEKYQMDYSVLPSNTNIDEFIELEVIDEVIYSKKEYNHQEVEHLIYSCQEIGATFRLRSQFSNLIAAKAHYEYVDALPTISFSPTSTDFLLLKLKEIIDFLFALIVLVMLSPAFLILGVLIKLDSKGPIFFKQERIGLRNRKFMLYKFRTMVKDAEELKAKLAKQNEQEGPVFKIKNDPRITRVGAFLRKTSLDELPQFINILKGEMALVGPRPPLESEVVQYERWQLRRLSMKPGITCIWQVSGRNNIGFEEWMRLDLRYIDNWSLKLDFILIFKTIGTMLKGTGQ